MMYYTFLFTNGQALTVESGEVPAYANGKITIKDKQGTRFAVQENNLMVEIRSEQAPTQKQPGIVLPSGPVPPMM